MFDITGHDSRSETVFIVTTTTFILATIFVAARLISRFVILKNRTADDWLILVSWVSPALASKDEADTGTVYCFRTLLQH